MYVCMHACMYVCMYYNALTFNQGANSKVPMTPYAQKIVSLRRGP